MGGGFFLAGDEQDEWDGVRWNASTLYVVEVGAGFEVGELGVKPGAGGSPFAFDGGGGDAHDFGHLVGGEATEEAEFDDLALARVEFFEFLEGIVEGDQGHFLLGEIIDGFFEGELVGGAAALLGVVGAGVLDEDAAHQLGGDAEEMGAVFPIDAGLIDQLEVGLVDEGGGLECVIGALAAHVGTGDAAEFVVDERQKLIGSAGLAVLEFAE